MLLTTSFLALAAALQATPTVGTPAPQAVPAQTEAAGEPVIDPVEQGETGAPTTSASQPGEILVTARRRSEAVQDVPIAISVVTGDELERTGTYNIAKLTQVQPSIQFFSTNPRNTSANIRGLGSPFGLTNDGIEQGVGIYIDQVYNSRIASATFDFLDVERLEVLRGPQGTLYGKNTTAGAINITTRAPSFTPEGRIELSLGNYDFIQTKGSVSGPLVDDKVAIRLAASATSRDGTIFNTSSGRRVNAQDNLGVRSQILWKATESIDLFLTGDYNRQDPECCAQIYVRTGSTQRPLNRQFAGPTGLAAAFGYAPPSTDPFDRLTDLDTPLAARQEIGGLSLRAEWDLGPGTLTSVSAWRFWNWHPSNDRDFTSLPITTVSANPSTQDQYTQELRYSGGGDTIDYTLGAFFFHQDLATAGQQVQGPAASRFLLNPTSANANNPAVLNGLRSVNDISFRNTSGALFGQLTWRVAQGLRVQPGLRVNYDKKQGNYLATVFNGAGVQLDCAPALTAANTMLRDQCSTLSPQDYDASFSDWNLSGDFTVSYDIAQHVLGYATFARSFKSGGINLSGLPLDASNVPIQSAGTVRPEQVDHFELGLKTQFWDRRATLNLSGYWTNIKDYQATVTNGQLGVLRGYLANAERVRVRGAELDFSVRPSTRISAYANLAYTDGTYRKFVDAPCPPELSGGTTVTGTQTPSAPGTPGGLSPANCNISGQWLPGISKFSASFGGEGNVPVDFGTVPGEIYLGAEGTYRSKFSSNASRSAYTDVNGYSVFNFRLGLRTDDGWNAFAWLRNAFDSEYFDVLALQSGNTGLVVGQPADPRTYGFTVAKSF